MLKVKRKFLKQQDKNYSLHIKESIRLSVDFSAEMLQTRMEGDETFKILKEKIANQENYTRQSVLQKLRRDKDNSRQIKGKRVHHLQTCL